MKSLSRVRLLATPWTTAFQAPPSMDFPGKSTGVGCHCLLRFLGISEFNSVAQSYPTLCDSMDCSTPDFLVHHQLLELAQTHVLRIGDVMPQSFSSFSSSRVEVSGLPNSSVALNNLFVLLFFVVLMQSDCSFLQSSRVLHFFQSIC